MRPGSSISKGMDQFPCRRSRTCAWGCLHSETLSDYPLANNASQISWTIEDFFSSACTAALEVRVAMTGATLRSPHKKTF